jgi:4-amino-4-deoxy-L-arabinose transferase-like glycosyltransferase
VPASGENPTAATPNRDGGGDQWREPEVRDLEERDDVGGTVSSEVMESARPDARDDVGQPARVAREPVLPATRLGWALVVLVLLVGLGLRTGVVLHTRKTYVPHTDAQQFDYTASSLVDHHNYGYAIVPPNVESLHQQTALRAPGYPVALAAVYAVVGTHSWTMGRLENALFGTVIIALIGIIAAQIWNRRLGLIAMAAVYPTLILIGSSLQLEPLLVMLMLGSVAAALQHRRKPRGWRWPALAGILVGLAILTRETGFFALLPVAWLVWTAGPDGTLRRPQFDKKSILTPVLVIVLAAAMVVPWTVRNAVKMHAFIPTTNSSGIGLAGTFNTTSMNDKRFPAGWRDPWDDPAMNKIVTDLYHEHASETKASKRLTSESLHLIRKHPDWLIKAGFWNTQRLFDLDGGDFAMHIRPSVPYPKSLLRLAIYSSWIMYVLAIAGAVVCREERRRVPWAVWLIPISTYPLLVFLLPANIRYRSWLEPFFLLLAAPLVAKAVEALRQRFAAPAA